VLPEGGFTMIQRAAWEKEPPVIHVILNWAQDLRNNGKTERAGKDVSVRSDLYSLGLVRYELFTGQQAFKASTAAELARLQAESTPTSPTRLVADFDLRSRGRSFDASRVSRGIAPRRRPR